MSAHSLAPGNLPSQSHLITWLPPQCQRRALVLLANQRTPPTCLIGSGMSSDPPYGNQGFPVKAGSEALGLGA